MDELNSSLSTAIIPESLSISIPAILYEISFNTMVKPKMAYIQFFKFSVFAFLIIATFSQSSSAPVLGDANVYKLTGKSILKMLYSNVDSSM